MGESNNHVVLYRKYRSQSFNEVVGQDHIVLPLKKEIEQDSIAHAYLFTGPRGVGKTSVARIFAFAINGLKYSEQLPIDIIEIDGASNRRIDEIRELKERIHVAPAQAKYKVYIIDEVHMLTKEAFNALLKTLEEPPAHAVFILATTEVHKMPSTIISRTQRHSFRPLSISDISNHLAYICEKEDIKFETEALELIALASDGSLRDAISLLDQISSLGDINKDNTENSLGITNLDNLKSLVDAVELSSPNEITSTLEKIIFAGSDSTQLANQVVEYIRKQKPTEERWLNLIDSLILVPASLRPDISLEIALLRSNMEMNPDAKLESKPKTAPITSTENKSQAKIKPSAKPEQIKQQPSDKKIEFNESVKSESQKNIDNNTWTEVLSLVKQQNNALYSVLRMCKANFDDSKITLSFKFEFHQKQIQNSKNMQILAKSIQQISGRTYEVITEIDKNITTAGPIEQAGQNQAVNDDSKVDDATSSVIEAMGGGEVIKI